MARNLFCVALAVLAASGSTAVRAERQSSGAFFPCKCDDPGLQGLVVGAPIGAVTGAVVATVLTR